MRYFFLWESISSLLGGRRVLAGLGTCGSVLNTNNSSVPGMSYSSGLFDFSDAACAVSLKWKVKCSAHYLECIISLLLPQLIRVTMLHPDFYFVGMSSHSPFNPTMHPLWMVRITVLSDKDCIFFSKFPSSRHHVLHHLVVPTEDEVPELELTHWSSQYSFNLESVYFKTLKEPKKYKKKQKFILRSHPPHEML